MFRHNYACAGLLGTAVAAVLLVANPAAAQQQGWPLNRGSYNGFTEGGSRSGLIYGTPATYAPLYAPTYAPQYPSAVVTPAAPQTEVRSFYPSPAADEYGAQSTAFTGKRPVRLNVSVPANAQLTLNGARTMQTGAIRAFVSPPVAPGHDYYYDVTATWQERGREVKQTKRIDVHAGDVIHVSF